MSTPRRMGFWLFLALGALASVVLVAAASRRSGTYWADFRDAAGEWVNPNGSGFLVVDVTGTPSFRKMPLSVTLHTVTTAILPRGTTAPRAAS